MREIEAGAPEICRICLSSESTEGNLLIQPCSCRGSVAYCHQTCLQQWLESKREVQLVCELCRGRLRIQAVQRKSWSLCVFAQSFPCMVLFLVVPIQIVLIVTAAKVGSNLRNHTNLYVFIGCLCGVLLTVVASILLIVWSCRSKLVSNWRVVPQHSEVSSSYVLP